MAAGLALALFFAGGLEYLLVLKPNSTVDTAGAAGVSGGGR